MRYVVVYGVEIMVDEFLGLACVYLSDQRVSKAHWKEGWSLGVGIGKKHWSANSYT